MLDDRINGLVLPEADQIGSSKQANSTALLSGDHFVELMDYITLGPIFTLLGRVLQ